MFVAIELPEKTREKLSAHARGLRESVPAAQASWSRPENIHLTLKFVGEITKDRAAKLSEATARAAEHSDPFRIEIAGTGAFPNRGVPRVLWIGLNDSEGGLTRLHEQLERECLRVGFEQEARSFKPHLTLARLRRPDHAKALAAAHLEMPFESEKFTATEVLVIRSELSSSGSKYTTISRHALDKT